MDSKAFVAALVDEMHQIFQQLEEHETLEAESGGRVEVETLLKVAMGSELEAAELAGYWMPITTEIEAKILFARQCGDEMRHYEIIRHRLIELGVDMEGFDPLAEGRSPLYHYMRELPTTAERVAAGVFASEAIAEVRNKQFVAFCQTAGDEKTAHLYRDTIGPEESHHHVAGRRYLEAHANDAATLDAVAAATRNTLAIAEELSTLSAKAGGLSPLPVS